MVNTLATARILEKGKTHISGFPDKVVNLRLRAAWFGSGSSRLVKSNGIRLYRIGLGMTNVLDLLPGSSSDFLLRFCHDHLRITIAWHMLANDMRVYTKRI